MREPCHAAHPERTILCERPPGNHPNHTVYSDDQFIDWPNPDYVAPAPRRATRQEQDARTRKIMKDIIDRTREGPTKPKYFPSENDRLGRVALYLRKYKGTWVSLEELQLKTVAGSGAFLCLTTLINRYGWEIKTKIQAKDERKFFMLVSE